LEQWKEHLKQKEEEKKKWAAENDRRGSRRPEPPKEYTEEDWKKWAAEKMASNPDSGWTEEQWVEWLKNKDAEKRKQMEEEGRGNRGRGGRSRSRGGKGKGKGGMPPMPEKLCGDKWEEPRAQRGLKLIGELAPAAMKWQYPLTDESRRCYAGFLPCPMDEAMCKDLFETIRDGTEWKQPEGRLGAIPRKTAWMVAPGCNCTYRYGSIEVDPQIYPPWMTHLMRIIMSCCGLTNEADWPNSCNLNLYVDGGMSVGWHSDDEALFQGKFGDITIVSLSLGQARRFELRTNWPEERERPLKRFTLGNGDLMTMEGMVQKHYMHRVPKEDGIEGPRINLTWRWTVKHRPRCPASRSRMSRNPCLAPGAPATSLVPMQGCQGAGPPPMIYGGCCPPPPLNGTAMAPSPPGAGAAFGGGCIGGCEQPPPPPGGPCGKGAPFGNGGFCGKGGCGFDGKGGCGFDGKGGCGSDGKGGCGFDGKGCCGLDGKGALPAPPLPPVVCGGCGKGMPQVDFGSLRPPPPAPGGPLPTAVMPATSKASAIAAAASEDPVGAADPGDDGGSMPQPMQPQLVQPQLLRPRGPPGSNTSAYQSLGASQLLRPRGPP